MIALKFAGATLLIAACSCLIPVRAAAQGTGSGAPSTTLPKDVDPVSRFRLPLPRKEDMDDYGKKVFDKLLDPSRPSLAGLQGPTGIRLWSPHIAEAMGDANAYLRVGTGF